MPQGLKPSLVRRVWMAKPKGLALRRGQSRTDVFYGTAGKMQDSSPFRNDTLLDGDNSLDNSLI